ncbi:hypothetical protein KUW17_14815 [Leisingera aquaemixtae]|uniref:hypothetical protein n=1 Tax=Leisingera TaxID=191028 RepID=UPI001C945D84|nr:MULTISPECIES: hypothetical protein [Leisingera]MBY6068024.1 hypothetical protein [Leisingera aquaemixtae]MCB4458270.1 hypothetical protein [Leisingera sp. McT4-56]
MTAHFLKAPAVLAAAAALSGPLLADQLYLDDAAACDRVLISQDGVADYANEGGLILHENGFSSMEYFCNFQPALSLEWGSYRVSDHTGRCELPGPQYFPQLFTVVLDPEEPGTVSVWMGEAEPLQFFACSS